MNKEMSLRIERNLLIVFAVIMIALAVYQSHRNKELRNSENNQQAIVFEPLGGNPYDNVGGE